MTTFDQKKISYEKWGLSDYKENLPKIKNLRKTYMHFPYLYAYDAAEEDAYHDAYMTAGEHLDAFVAIHDEELIGISIGCPLMRGIAICADLVDTELSKGKPYYFGDIIIDKNYWGQGIASALYKNHLKYISKKGYSHVLALLVEKNDDDPRTPSKFKKSDLWSSFQFHPTNFTINYSWKTFTASGEIKQEKHTLRAYIKNLG
tara:strand:- start:2791 stop:3399 length:609 start_codon:yes stop_codon:yes gene_type:complete